MVAFALGYGVWTFQSPFFFDIFLLSLIFILALPKGQVMGTVAEFSSIFAYI